jgi:predicted N-formylglutamate amidohydrolase
MADGERDPIIVENPEGNGSFVIVCDHASRNLPPQYHSLGLQADALSAHIAWDPGGLAVARHLSRRLDAPLVWPDISRLVIDCNRPPDAPDLIVTTSEGREVPGNRDLTDTERERRLATYHAPYHAAIDDCLDGRISAGRATAVVAVHSFTEVYLGKRRPWQVGVVFDDDRQLADPFIGRLKTVPALTVGINQPYSPADRVYYTVSRHAAPRRLPGIMIEIRNDQIADDGGQHRWGERLADIFLAVTPSMAGGGHAVA